MRSTHFVFGVISLLLGAAILLVTLPKGLSLNLGLVFGSLLLFNGAARIWFWRRLKAGGA